MLFRKHLLTRSASLLFFTVLFPVNILLADGNGPHSPVAKKGVGDYPGVLNSVADMGEMKVGWYYDWGPDPVGRTPGIQFVPMIWGQQQLTDANLAAAKRTGAGVLLGFNEPNEGGQSNMTVEQAIADWPQLEATGLRLGSPASGTGDDIKPAGWLATFMAQAKSLKYRVDFICLHPYQSSLDVDEAVKNLKAELTYVHDAYGLPIWITEYGQVDWNNNRNPDVNTAASFAAKSAALLNSLPYVERFAWYSLIPNQGTLSLTNGDGTLNKIGVAWEDAPGGKAGAMNKSVNLVPDEAATAPNYFCTWATQNYMYGQGFQRTRGRYRVVAREPGVYGSEHIWSDWMGHNLLS